MNRKLPWIAAASLVLLSGCHKREAQSPDRGYPPPRVSPAIPVANNAPVTETTAKPPPLAMDMPGEPAITAKVEPYTVSADLKEIANLKEFAKYYRLSDAQRDLLNKNLFVCSPTDYRQLCFLYENNNYLNLPSFVSTDAMLQLYHVFYDSTLREVETTYLVPTLRRLTRGMYADSLKMLDESGSGPVQEAATKNAAYFAVAMQLIGDKVDPPTAVAPLVRVERSLIDGHAGFALGGIFPYKLDYSQFVPRGHYTGSTSLKQYFMAMMWYGTAPFALTYDGPGGPVRADEQIRQSLLLTASLYRTNLDAEWVRLYEPTSFYVGSSDDLTPADWRKAAETVFGKDAAPGNYADDGKLTQFVDEVKKLKPARIAPKLVLEKQVPDTDRQLRFMGQRYIVDSEAIQKLVNDQRPLPSGLDAMAALGSPRAPALLDAHADLYNPRKWDAYTSERDKVVAAVAALPQDEWTSNLYWGWLHVLRALLAPVPDGYPSFMRSEAWADKSVHTALGSWSELRHDTILYAKPTVAEMGDGDDRPMPKSYVEPNVRFWDRLLALTEQSRAGLERRGMISSEIKDRFHDFMELLRFLRAVSEKELRNEEISNDEYQKLREIGGEIDFMTLALIPNHPNDWSLVTPVDRDMAVIADVHTAPPLCWEVGVGHAYEMLVVVPIRGKLYLTRGACFSYYEFPQQMAGRLTDEKWQKMLVSPKPPAAPVWTGSFLTAAKPQVRDPGSAPGHVHRAK